MIRRQHQVSDFFEEGAALRAILDERFKNPYVDSIPWYYFCDPRMYTYLRTSPEAVFPKPLFDSFMRRLRGWCMEQLGLTPLGLPNLHLMVNGCRLGLHSDFHNGTWGYVYSLTRWNERRFIGGETLVMRDGVPSYKKHHVHGEVLYELIPAQFNQLFVFDDRIVHATPTVEGSMDPLDGRIAMVGHMRATSPVVTGSLPEAAVRKAFAELLLYLRERTQSFRDVQGMITFRLEVAASGKVQAVSELTNNVITAASGYERSEPVDSVLSIVRKAVHDLKFAAAAGSSVVILPILLPIPNLKPIEFAVSYEISHESMHEWAVQHLAGGGIKLEGSWDGEGFVVREPIAGTIRIEPRQVTVSFDAPMWVPSQREHFQTGLQQWVQSAGSRAQ